MSVYYYVLDASFPDRTVTASIYYTGGGELVTLSPLSRAELVDVVRTRTSLASAEP